MKKHLLIIGGGHAGTSAALAAARQRMLLGKEENLTITLVNKSAKLGIRPRYYEYELEDTQVDLHRFLTPLKINVIVGEIKYIDLENNIVVYHENSQSHDLKFDSVVIALGSQLQHPNIVGIEKVYNIDTYVNAKVFRSALEQRVLSFSNIKIAILGGGLAGLELACELPLTLKKIIAKFQLRNRTIRTYLIDKNQIEKNLGDNPRTFIKQALDQAKVDRVDHALINAIKGNVIYYNDSDHLHVDMIVSTLGLRANNLSNMLNLPTDSLGRIKVTSYLSIPQYSHCFAAGDIACALVDETHWSPMSCQHSRPQGRYAGYNAVSLLFKQKLLPYSQPQYVTCVDLGAYGAIFTQGWDRKVKLSGKQAKIVKQQINRQRIYPPTSTNRVDLYNAGKLESVSPLQSIQEK